MNRKQIISTLKKKTSGKTNGDKFGYVYAIANPSFPNMVKIGSAFNIKSRLSQYQTSDPFRQFYIIDKIFCEDRKCLETTVRSLFTNYKNEWVISTPTEVKSIFSTIKINQFKMSDEQIKLNNITQLNNQCLGLNLRHVLFLISKKFGIIERNWTISRNIATSRSFTISFKLKSNGTLLKIENVIPTGPSGNGN